jgi:hypothetical protein
MIHKLISTFYLRSLFSQMNLYVFLQLILPYRRYEADQVSSILLFILCLLQNIIIFRSIQLLIFKMSYIAFLAPQFARLGL